MVPVHRRAPGIAVPGVLGLLPACASVECVRSGACRVRPCVVRVLWDGAAWCVRSRLPACVLGRALPASLAQDPAKLPSRATQCPQGCPLLPMRVLVGPVSCPGELCHWKDTGPTGEGPEGYSSWSLRNIVLMICFILSLSRVRLPDLTTPIGQNHNYSILCSFDFFFF